MKLPHLVIVEVDDGNRRSMEQFFKSSGIFAGCVGFDALQQAINSEILSDNSILLVSLADKHDEQVNHIHKLKQKFQNIKILLLSSPLSGNNVIKYISAGASGIMDSSASLSKIKDSLLIIHGGGSVITPTAARKVFDHLQPSVKQTPAITKRQQDILKGMLDGLSYQSIGDRLHISINTVRKYVRQLYGAYNVKSKGELLAKYHTNPNKG